MWLIYRKKLNLLSKLLFLSFEKSNFWSFWGPQKLLFKAKSTQILDSSPLSMPYKIRPWGNHFKNLVLYLLYILSLVHDKLSNGQFGKKPIKIALLELVNWEWYPSNEFFHSKTHTTVCNVNQVPFYIAIWDLDHLLNHMTFHQGPAS